MTPTLARMVAARANALPRRKWFSMPRLCGPSARNAAGCASFSSEHRHPRRRHAPGRRGVRVRGADFFRDLGLTPAHVQLRLNSRALVASMLEVAAIGRNASRRSMLPWTSVTSTLEAFREMLAKLELDAAQQDMLVELGEARGAEGLDRVGRRLEKHEAGRAHYAVCRVFTLLGRLGVGDYCTYDMGVVRGWPTTRSVFEAFGLGGLRRAICGGGGMTTCSVTLAGRPGRRRLRHQRRGHPDVLAEFGRFAGLAEETDVFVIDADPARFMDVLELVGNLAAQPQRPVCLRPQSVGKQFKQAAARHPRGW